MSQIVGVIAAISELRVLVTYVKDMKGTLRFPYMLSVRLIPLFREKRTASYSTDALGWTPGPT